MCICVSHLPEQPHWVESAVDINPAISRTDFGHTFILDYLHLPQINQVNGYTILNIRSTSKGSMASTFHRKWARQILGDQKGDGNIYCILWRNATGGESIELLERPISTLLLSVGRAADYANDVVQTDAQEAALKTKRINNSDR
ncbi:MAG: hypothetical protein Q9172_004755 [Xanthocarpia lactea]